MGFGKIRLGLGSWVYVLVLLSQPVWAFTPLRDPKGLAKPVSEEVVHVASARVILANYALLKQDFPQLRNMSDAEIDSWLLQYTAFVSKAQADQANVNTPIQTTPDRATAFRPTDYGRALVFKTDNGLIDAKGTGTKNTPIQAANGHGNGLATLGETIREYLYEGMVHRVLQESKSGFETVRCYGVIDYGFDVKHADGSTSPAGLLLRQAHDRSTETSYSGWSNEKSLEAERALRPFGITSAGAEKNQPVEKINIQGTKDQKAIVDFGGFIVETHFDKPARNWDGGPILLDPKSPDFIQPDSALEIPFNVWGYSETGVDDPKFDNPWVYSHRLADSIRRGAATRADAETHIQTMMNPVEKILTSIASLGCFQQIFSQ